MLLNDPVKQRYDYKYSKTIYLIIRARTMGLKINLGYII